MLKPVLIYCAAVSRAFSCLSDPEKRSNYDQYGHEDRAQAAAHHSHYHEFYAEDLDPQEIFNMFFGGVIYLLQQGCNIVNA